MNANSDLISRSDAIKRAKAAEIKMGSINGIKAVPVDSVVQFLSILPAVDAVGLPVHVQQIVYADLRPWETTLNVQPFMVTCITVTQNKKGDWTKKFRANWFRDGKSVDVSRDFRFDEIGNRVFFTKEEAEAVLRRDDDA